MDKLTGWVLLFAGLILLTNIFVKIPNLGSWALAIALILVGFLKLIDR